jgi:UDP-glucose 4-epimerase
MRMICSVVTGGAGFIGSHIVEALVARGERVRVLDDLSTGRAAHLAAVQDDIEFRRGSVCDPRALDEVMRGAQFVFHMAAVASVPLSLDQPVLVNRVNVEGTVAVLEAARRHGVLRVVIAASSSAYGDSDALPSREDQPVAPVSPYAVSKVVGEMYGRVFTRLLGVDTVALRYFNVYGPRQDPAGPYAAVIPRFVTAALGGEPLTIYGTGAQTRDFVFVEDVVQANLLARTAPLAPGGVYNIGSGRGTSLNELVETLQSVCARPLTVRRTPARAGDVMHSRADVKRARHDLGFEPTVSLEDGLGRTVAWWESTT